MQGGCWRNPASRRLNLTFTVTWSCLQVRLCIYLHFLGSRWDQVAVCLRRPVRNKSKRFQVIVKKYQQPVLSTITSLQLARHVCGLHLPKQSFFSSQSNTLWILGTSNHSTLLITYFLVVFFEFHIGVCVMLYRCHRRTSLHPSGWKTAHLLAHVAPHPASSTKLQVRYLNIIFQRSWAAKWALVSPIRIS